MANKKNRKCKCNIRQDRTKDYLKRLTGIGAEALLKGLCGSIGSIIGTASLFWWWALIAS